MEYHTRTKWADGDMTVSELPFDSIKAAAEAVVSEGDFNTGHVCQLFGLFEDDDEIIIGFADRTSQFKAACYEVWLNKYDANYCLNGDVPKLIEDKVDERFVLDITGDHYIIRRGME